MALVVAEFPDDTSVYQIKTMGKPVLTEHIHLSSLQSMEITMALTLPECTKLWLLGVNWGDQWGNLLQAVSH